MGDPKTVLEGNVKYRDKKKWKGRWAVVSKLSPVADCLHIQLYRDSKERCKHGPTKASLSLEGFLGMETGFTLDKESHTMSLICTDLVVVLAFDNRELLIQWQVKIRANLVEEQQFLVQLAHVPPKSKLPCGPARLHLQDYTFCMVSGIPPRLLGIWPIKELRRFGLVEGKYCFEGGSLCGKGEGLHVLLTNQCEELSQAMELASKGKLLGKRKTLSRKNSVLESSSRMPLHHKRCAMNTSSSKSIGGDSHRPLLSSGSESSTCDACSEVLRSVDDIVYSSSASSIKASSCRVHYRWPSCLSRWGQSSTTTASDVDSVDTVSVILSDLQGSSQSGTMSKTNGQSLSCLCDTQGTWPFNQCTKCGRQFYSRNSLHSCKGKPNSSPEHIPNEDVNGFSPQWTMDSLVGSCQKKESAYQLMNPPSDRASLCSQSSSASSGSEYSVPKNFLQMLYDKPKHMQHAVNTSANGKTADARRPCAPTEQPASCKPPGEILCPCHEPVKDWMTSMEASNERLMGQPDCACWNTLTMSTMNSRAKSASANVSPNSSPKKARYNGGITTLRSLNNGHVDSDVPCSCDLYANYAIPKSAVMHTKDVPKCSAPALNGTKDASNSLPTNPSEDYDVPKKFTDLVSNCDMTQKSSAITKSIINGPSCSCINSCKLVPNIDMFKIASTHSYQHKHGSLNHVAKDALQMCACQRVMLWAGSLVPCLGPQATTLETGWQCAKSLPSDSSGCGRSCHSRMTAVCHEPHRTAEVVMVNGKLKHVLRDSSLDIPCDAARSQPIPKQPFRPRANTVSYPLSTMVVSEHRNADSVSCNYANIDFPNEDNVVVKISDDSTAINYANIEFAETLSLYENSNLVLSRMDSEDKKSSVCSQKPPLPPRFHANVVKTQSGTAEVEENCKQRPTSPEKLAPRQVNGSAYEMMCYQQKSAGGDNDEDYLLMQPICMQDDEPIRTEEITESNRTCNSKPGKQIEAQSTLPLRPFMPFSYSTADANTSVGFPVDTMSRKHQLMSEDLHMRAMRSNSLSELKKKVLMRKRSSSVDGKNNGYISKDSGTESVPASPVGSPRSSVQRKNSLFAKINLRSKEKSMSTNEIGLPSPTRSANLNNSRKSGLHRSADCLKLSEEFANSEEDLNSDNSDFVLKDSSSSPMKRSFSVPCRARTPTVTVTSPARVNGTILELNDLNKEDTGNQKENTETGQEFIQRKYSLDSHVRSKQRVPLKVGENCDNRRDGLDESDTIMEMEGVMRRHNGHPSCTENYRSNTSSCSSSDISDYMESLSFISRSSSSSSGSTSSADYMRTDDIYRTLSKPPQKTVVHHQSHDTSRIAKHRSCDSSSSLDTSSSGSYHMVTCCRDTNQRPCTGNQCNSSRSSTSSTSSLSTSPGVTDYSSSSSSPPPLGQGNLPSKPVLHSKRRLQLTDDPHAMVGQNVSTPTTIESTSKTT